LFSVERRKAGVSRHTHRSRPNSGKSKHHFKANQLAEPQTRDIGKPPTATPTASVHSYLLQFVIFSNYDEGV